MVQARAVNPSIGFSVTRILLLMSVTAANSRSAALIRI
jgi:hypothetical protein